VLRGELGLLVEDWQDDVAGGRRQPEDALRDAQAGEVVQLAAIGMRTEGDDLEFAGVAAGVLGRLPQDRESLAEPGAPDRDPALAVLDDVCEELGAGAAAQQASAAAIETAARASVRAGPGIARPW